MKYLVMFRALYLMTYFAVLSKRPSALYSVSVVMAASASLSFFLLLVLSYLIHISFGIHDKGRFPFEALLFHGLSFEEWRGAKEVKEKMDAIQKVSRNQLGFSEHGYFILLLIMAFSGLIEYRTETPEERADVDLGKLPREGEVVRAYRIDLKSKAITKMDVRPISSEETEFLDGIKKDHIEHLTANLYRGKTLSRLVYDGVRILFLRKKIGPKRPAKAESFANAFGIRIS